MLRKYVSYTVPPRSDAAVRVAVHKLKVREITEVRTRQFKSESGAKP